MKHTTLSALIASGLCLSAASGKDFQFEEPQVVTSAGKPISVDNPGYAAPCLADVDGDGSLELLVGQFAGGHISVFEKNDDGGLISYAAGEKLKAEGETAEVPGVW